LKVCLIGKARKALKRLLLACLVARLDLKTKGFLGSLWDLVGLFHKRFVWLKAKKPCKVGLPCKARLLGWLWFK
tara:strand:- start:1785 stop:2006 length:222 start_codon:yes stop_codon:yes gene_type:complete